MSYSSFAKMRCYICKQTRPCHINGQGIEDREEKVVMVKARGVDEETEGLEQDYEEDEECNQSLKIVVTQTPCDEDTNYYQTMLCDLCSLVVNNREMLANVTTEGQQLFVLPTHFKKDIVFDCTDEGNHRGYAALLSRQTKEIFLWHILEMACTDVDGNVMFPEKVQIPTLSSESLIRISK